jgi:hypothetical protein
MCTFRYFVFIALAFLMLIPCSNGQAADPQAVGTAPPYCHPCLFYGGDFDAANPLSGSIGNMDTLEIQNQETEVPFRIRSGQTWTVIALFSNNFATVPHLYPPQIEWSIREGITAGRGGKLIASGTVAASLTPTGRSFEGEDEYTALGYLSPNTIVTLGPGIYWMTAVPVCNVDLVDTCQGALFSISSVEDVPPPNHVGYEPNDHSYIYWLDGRDYFAPLAGQGGLCTTGCDRFSAGLLGFSTTN